MQTDALDRGPDSRQATGLCREHVNLIKLVREALVETTDGAGTGGDSREGFGDFPHLVGAHLLSAALVGLLLFGERRAYSAGLFYRFY